MKKAFIKKSWRSGLAGALLLLLAGCISENAANMEHAKALRVGMSL